MSFRVESADLDSYGNLLKRATEDVQQCIGYLKQATVDKGLVSEFWEMCTSEHEKYVSDGETLLTKVRGILDSASGELAKVAAYYRDTDSDEAARMDAAYPGSKQRAPGNAGSGSGASFQDVRDAGNELKPVGGDKNYLEGHLSEFSFAPVHKTVGTFMDFGSPSAIVNEGCKLFLGIDPFGEALKWVTGDWDTYTDCGTAWANLGKACGAIADNIKSGNDVLAGSWEGNAADAAWAYFDEFQTKLRSIEEGLSSLEGHYGQVAHYIFALAEVLKAGLAFIADRIITAMVFQAAAFAASATGVGLLGGAASAALAAAQATLAVMKWAELTAQFTKTAMALTLALGASSAIMGTTVDAVQGFPEVGGGYDHKAV
ncbi:MULTISPECIES: WXG100 family type VII secretion target [unclassified Streptomyces]|uniref:WXG100 family type VII secretion target n=1 Tax=unclassified Streptomyces TaxID=2593676 RepID=UPI00131A58D6|nr:MULTISPECIES: hypothetical protein [unclassified Streptomyces]